MSDILYARRADAMTANLGDELAVLDLPSGAYLGFNATAAHVWRALERPATLKALCEAMTAEFDVAPDRCRAEVQTLLDRLTAAGLVTADARAIEALGRLSWADRGLLAEAVLRLAAAGLALKLMPFQRLTGSLAGGGDAGPAPVLAQRVRGAVTVAARRSPVSLTCLPQALATAWMLRARGQRPKLHYGVAAADGGFRAHAWVELAGTPVIGERGADDFTLLAVFPPDAAA